ncbi:MAG: hypothetical protein R3F15_11710 [Lysobacterales bacterium]
MRTQLTMLISLTALLLSVSSTGIAATAAAPGHWSSATATTQADWRLQGNNGLGRTRGQPNDDQADEEEEDKGGEEGGGKRRKDKRDD